MTFAVHSGDTRFGGISVGSANSSTLNRWLTSWRSRRPRRPTAPATFRLRVDFEASNGLNVSEAPLGGFPRAAWIDGSTATVIVAREPYIIEMRDADGRDLELTILIGGPLEAIR